MDNKEKEKIVRDKFHVYHVGNKNLISVTTLISRWFDKFDADNIIFNMMKSQNWETSPYFGMDANQIKKKWDQERDLGSQMHEKIESILMKKEKELFPPEKEKEKEIAFFRNFLRDNSLKEYLCEYMIFSKDLKVAGTIDALLIDKEGNYWLCDWKRSKDIKKEGKRYGYGPFCDVIDCNYNKYMIQLNMYRHILETNYEIKVKEMRLVNLYPDNENYVSYDVPFFPIDEVWDSLFFR